jgi:hypothetical protein
MSRYPTRSPSKLERFHEEPDPQSQGLRNKNGPCEPSRRHGTWGPPRPRLQGLTARTPASLKGQFTRRIFHLSRLVSYLADECNRPNCQRETTTAKRTHQRRIEPSLLGTTAEGNCRTLFHRHHRPVQGCVMAARPGRRVAWVVNEATAMVAKKLPASTPAKDFSCYYR